MPFGGDSEARFVILAEHAGADLVATAPGYRSAELSGVVAHRELRLQRSR